MLEKIYDGEGNVKVVSLGIDEHVPTKIRLGNYFADHINNKYGSAIAEHLINNRDCASSYIADLFTILSMSHSYFHLKM